LDADPVEQLLKIDGVHPFVLNHRQLYAVHSMHHPHQHYCVDGARCSCQRKTSTRICVHRKAVVQFVKRFVIDRFG
jgi:hypothetical protein